MCVLKTSDDLCFGGFIKYPYTEIQKNEFVFITGESGCGKSSFLRLLNLSALPSSGKIYYRGQDIRELPVLEYRRDVLLAPQEIYLFEGSIIENFNIYRKYCDKPPLRVTEAERFLKICRADFPADLSCRNLSGGEKQRVFLAVFLSCMPKVLLLDEPTAALDEKTASELMSGLKSFCSEEGITAVMVCHSRDLADTFGDRVIRFGKEGRA